MPMERRSALLDTFVSLDRSIIAALGYPICALVRISPHSLGLPHIPEIARSTPEVTECYRVTGED